MTYLPKVVSNIGCNDLDLQFGDLEEVLHEVHALEEWQEQLQRDLVAEPTATKPTKHTDISKMEMPPKYGSQCSWCKAWPAKRSFKGGSDVGSLGGCPRCWVAGILI